MVVDVGWYLLLLTDASAHLMLPLRDVMDVLIICLVSDFQNFQNCFSFSGFWDFLVFLIGGSWPGQGPIRLPLA